MNSIIIGLHWIGLIVFLMGAIQFLIAECSINFWWLLGGIFFPIVDLVFLCVHFDEAWPSTKKCLIGVLLVATGAYLHSGGIA